jgi:hypothetical protein
VLLTAPVVAAAGLGKVVLLAGFFIYASTSSFLLLSSKSKLS